MTLHADEELIARVRGQFQRPKRFERASFLASLAGHRMNAQTGVIQVSFDVGHGEQEGAFEVRHARGELVLVTVERVSLAGNGKRRAKKS